MRDVLCFSRLDQMKQESKLTDKSQTRWKHVPETRTVRLNGFVTIVEAATLVVPSFYLAIGSLRSSVCHHIHRKESEIHRQRSTLTAALLCFSISDTLVHCSLVAYHILIAWVVGCNQLASLPAFHFFVDPFQHGKPTTLIYPFRI